MYEKNLYLIRYVSQRTGLTSHVIRAWESRYRAVVPQRSPKNRRLYSEDDVQHLLLLKSLTEAGHNISQVAPLSPKELAALAQREAVAMPAIPKRSKIQSQLSSVGHFFKECLQAVLNLDPDALERLLDQAAIDLTRPVLLNDLIVPLFREIGKLWHGGALKILNEHMATTVTRTFLLNMLRSTHLSDSAPRILIATPVGQWHDVGALTVALTAAENGWHPIYYGPDLPAEEIAAGVKQSGARAVAISITHLLTNHPFTSELRKLRRYIGKDLALFVGGRGVVDQSDVLLEIEARCITDIEQFSDELNRLIVEQFV